MIIIRFVEHTSAVNVKRTWVDFGLSRDWMDDNQGQGDEFLYHATQVLMTILIISFYQLYYLLGQKCLADHG